MRISTALMYQTGSTAISRQQSELSRTQQQISTGRRMLAPSDDPVAASEALRVEQGRALTSQYLSAQGAARDRLSILEVRLGDAGDMYQSLRQLTVQAGNAALSNADRASLAREVRGLQNQLLAIANSSDGQGGYLFSGFNVDTQPFDRTPAGITYNGDQGQRLLEVAAGRQIAVTANGAQVFDRVRDGNGVFATRAGAVNTGTAVVSAGSVTDASLITRHDYQINFSVVAGVTTYDVLDLTAGTTLSTGNAYAAGDAIAFDGLSFKVDGAPANGDSLSVRPSQNSSVFDMVDALARALETPVITSADKAELQNSLGQAMTHLDRAIDTALDVRTGVGAALRELDGLGDMASADALQADARLGELRDLDLAEAISRLSLQSTALEAAQQAYLRTTGLTLFNFLN
ncbi:MAG: flagellar hook-associated protein FlgL [Burkholderiales bacterium]|nr:flagellar hook-associated protein FlgL [Burkholderiales bacterium]